MLKYIKNIIKAKSKDDIEHYYELIGDSNKVANLSDIWKIAKEELLILKELGLLDLWTKYEAYKDQTPQQIFEAWQNSILQELENIHEAVLKFKTSTKD